MKIKALLYCTKNKVNCAYLVNYFGYRFVRMEEREKESFDILNGKIVCECEVDTEEIKLIENEEQDMFFETNSMKGQTLDKRSCLKEYELDNYLNLYSHEIGDKCGYALHLSNVKERVMELSRCYSQWQVDHLNVEEYFIHIKGIEKAPQNMQWVYILNHEDKLEKRLLISVRPQWLCKILNGEKTIEVRRKVLKGMCD